MSNFARSFARSVVAQIHRLGFYPSACGSVVLLLGWMLLAGLLRCYHLTAKPLWTDEFSTLVFGLGHSFQTIPVNQVIDAETLLAPIKPTGDTTLADAARYLLKESNHPPLYFMLTHVWTRLFPTQDGYVSVGGARSLSVVFGVLSIPAMYGLGWVAFRCRAIAHLAAALMAVSPFGVYLAQDARHYTLTVVWMIISLACLIQAVRHHQGHTPLPMPVVLLWIGVNGLGMASHYFFALTLLAEAIALVILIGVDGYQPRRQSHHHGLRQSWKGTGRIGMAIAGTLISGTIWLPFLLSIRQGDALTQWLEADGWNGLAWLDPLLHTIGSIASMVMLLPVQNVDSSVAIASGIGIAVMMSLVGWLTVCGITAKWTHGHWPRPLLVLLVFTGGAIALILLITYGMGIQLAQVFRYHFVYFPAMLLLIATGMGEYWQSSEENSQKNSSQFYRQRRWLVVMVVVLGLIGSLTVAADLGYRKLHRPDRVVRDITRHSEAPVLLAMSHQTHGQTGRLMALAWEMRSPSSVNAIRQAHFFLDHRDCTAENASRCNQPSDHLRHIINTYSRPVDVWLLNYEGQANLQRQGCTYERTERTDGYKAQHYRCR